MTKEEVYAKWGENHGAKINKDTIGELGNDLKGMLKTVDFDEFNEYVKLKHEEADNESNN